MNSRYSVLALMAVGFLLTACSTSGLFSAKKAVIPATQMAIVQVGNGGPEVLQYQSIPVLKPESGQVLIKIVAAAINPIDWRTREGGRPPAKGAAGASSGSPRPQKKTTSHLVPGSDVAGIVVALGEGVSNVNEGDAVFAKLIRGQDQLNGAYSEYAVAQADQVVAKPADHTYAEAAGLGTVGTTAMRVIEHAEVRSGQRVFINGIAGGIGSSAAQFAKARGAYVLGTASGRHHDYLKTINVDEAINYREVQFDQVIEEPVDVVIETVSTATANQALNILKPGGQLVSIAGAADEALCVAANVTCARLGGAVGRSTPDLMVDIGRLAEAGLYRLNVDATFPLEEAGAAQDQNHNVGTQGKIILVVDAELANQK